MNELNLNVHPLDRPLLDLEQVEIQIDLNYNIGPFNLELYHETSTALIGLSRSHVLPFLHMASLLEPPTAGMIRFDGDPVHYVNENILRSFRSRMGIVLDPPGLMSNMDVMNNILLPVKYHCPEKLPEKTQFIEKWFGYLGLEWMIHQFPASIDHGHHKIAALFRAMINDPEILILMNPFVAIESNLLLQVLDFLSDFRKNNRLALFFTSEYHPFVETLADRIIRY